MNKKLFWSIMKYGYVATLMFFFIFGYFTDQNNTSDNSQIETKIKTDVSELTVLKDPQFLTLAIQMNLKTPSERLRVIVSKQVQGDKNQLDNFSAVLKEWTDINNPIEISKALRLSYILRNDGQADLSKKIIFHFLGQESAENYKQLTEKILQKVVENKIQVDNAEKLLAVVVFDSIMEENSEDVYKMLEESFNSTNFDVIQKTGDYGQIYIWQLIGLYNQKFYTKILKSKLAKLYEKEKPEYQNNLRYQESYLIFQKK